MRKKINSCFDEVSFYNCDSVRGNYLSYYVYKE